MNDTEDATPARCSRGRLRKLSSWLRRDVTWSIGANVALAGQNVITGIVVARMLGPHGRGQFALVVLWATVLCTIIEGGLPQAFAFFAGRHVRRAGGVAKLALCCAVLQGAIAVLIARASFPLLLRSQGAEVVRLSMLFALVAPAYIACEYLHNILRGSGQVRAYCVMRVGATAGYVVIVSAIALLHAHTVAAMALGLAISHVCSATFALFLVWRGTDCSRPVTWDLLQPSLSYGARSFMAGISWLANTRFDQMVMTWFLSPRQIGCYVAAVSLGATLSILAQSFANVTLPRVTMSPDLASAGRVLRRAVVGSVFVIVPVGGLLCLGAHWLLTRFYGPDFAEGTLAARILLIASMALGLNRVLSEALRGLNRPSGPAFAEMLGLVVSFVALWLLLPPYGIVGAALASLVAYFVVMVILIGCLVQAFASGQDLRRPVADLVQEREVEQTEETGARSWGVERQRVAVGALVVSSEVWETEGRPDPCAS